MPEDPGGSPSDKKSSSRSSTDSTQHKNKPLGKVRAPPAQAPSPESGGLGLELGPQKKPPSGGSVRPSEDITITNRMLARARQTGRDQWWLFSQMILRRELFVPMLSIWVASFGSSLHDPVTTYFLMELGASTQQVGNFAAITTFGGLLMTPFYGYLLDTRTAYLPCVLSAGCCAFGCLIRGFAPPADADFGTVFLYGSHALLGLGAVNLWTTVGTYVALCMLCCNKVKHLGLWGKAP